MDNSKPPRIDVGVSPLGPISYRIFPSWCTSYLWDPVEVDHASIMSRYPRLSKSFFEWADIYDDSFERQECHYGSRLPTFPCVDELVAWATEGVLMACWLSLQDHVYEVKYMPHGSFEYYLRKGQLEEELERFLVDMEALLQAEFPPGQGQESHSK